MLNSFMWHPVMVLCRGASASQSGGAIPAHKLIDVPANGLRCRGHAAAVSRVLSRLRLRKPHSTKSPATSVWLPTRRISMSVVLLLSVAVSACTAVYSIPPIVRN